MEALKVRQLIDILGILLDGILDNYLAHAQIICVNWEPCVEILLLDSSFGPIYFQNIVLCDVICFRLQHQILIMWRNVGALHHIFLLIFAFYLELAAFVDHVWLTEEVVRFERHPFLFSFNYASDHTPFNL